MVKVNGVYRESVEALFGIEEFFDSEIMYGEEEEFYSRPQDYVGGEV